MNHNAIRQHLAKLRDVALVIEEHAAPSGPGRPRLMYRVNPGAADRVGSGGPYEALSMMLLSLVRGEGSPAEVGRRVGVSLAAEHRAGRSDAAQGTVDVLDALASRMGFEPIVEPTPDGDDVVLARCPFVGPAGASPEIVCALHRGLAVGIAEEVGDGCSIVDLQVHPPEEANCRIVVTDPSSGNDGTPVSE